MNENVTDHSRMRIPVNSQEIWLRVPIYGEVMPVGVDCRTTARTDKTPAGANSYSKITPKKHINGI